MKTKSILYLLLSLGIFAGCTPGEGEVLDFSNAEIEKIELSADHDQLIADGKATLTLNPMLYQKAEGEDGVVYGRIPADRISGDMVKYFLEDGTELEGPEYRTTDASKGEVSFYIMANGVKSNLFTVKLREPFAKDKYETITYPVVFHVVQDQDNVDRGQVLGADMIYEVFAMIQNAFAGNILGPCNVDTGVRFQLAEYTPAGAKMQEKGINRLSLYGSNWNYFLQDFEDEIKDYQAKNILWDYTKYLNIWIIERAAGESVARAPHYILAGTEALPGIDAMEEKTAEEFKAFAEVETKYAEWSIFDIGLVFDLEQFGDGDELDCGHVGQIGKFFGLLPTVNEINGVSDYCDDTMPYERYTESWYDKNGYDANNRLKITEDGLLFYSTNIMDDASFRSSITMDQMKRMRTITDNCPLRWAWKSKWAFTGKED